MLREPLLPPTSRKQARNEFVQHLMRAGCSDCLVACPRAWIGSNYCCRWPDPTGMIDSMASGVIVALITADTAFAVSSISFPLNQFINQCMRRAQTLDLMGRYRDPLLWSVHDLRSRIRTILDEDFLERYLVSPKTLS